MEPLTTPDQARRRLKKLLVRIVISCLLLGYILYANRRNFSSIADAIRSANFFWLIVAFSLHTIGFLLTAFRWQMLLAARGAHFSAWYLVRAVLIGIFFNNFLPSTFGGDVFRAYDTSQKVGSLTESMTVVLVERLTGIFALGVFALMALLLGFSHFGQIPIIWLALGGLLVAFLLFLAAMNRTVAKTVKAVFDHPELIKIPFLRNVQARLKQIYEALSVYQRNKRVMAVAFLLALLLQINVILHYYCIAYAMGLAVPVLYFFLIVPVVTIVLMLPVFINGIGGREAAYILLLGQFGVASAQAIAFSWISFGMVLIQGIIGGIVYALRKN